jgi:hypothetical protein
MTIIAGLKYIKAGGEGGFAVAKDVLKFALIGFLVPHLLCYRESYDYDGGGATRALRKFFSGEI